MTNQPFKELLKNSNFTKLWTSQMLSQYTVNLVNFLMLTRIFAVTHSTVAVSLIWIVWSLPAFVFGPFSGAIVDNFSRRQVMIVTNLMQAIAIASYLLVQQYVYGLYIIVFLYSFFDQFYVPAQQASIPNAVDKTHLAAANGIFLLTQEASVLVGLGLGGVLLGLFGTDFAIILSAIALIIAGIAVYLLPRDQPRRSSIEKDLGAFWRDFRHGYQFVKSHHSVLFPLGLIVSVQVFISIVGVLLPSYTKNVLNTDLNRAGLILIVPGALGAIFVTYLIPRFLKYRRKKSILQAGLIVASLSLLVLAALPIITSGRVLFAALIAFGLGMSLGAVTVPAQTLLQEKTPTWLRGRVYSSLGSLMTIATAFPLILAAALADLLGVPAIMLILSLSLFAVFIFIIKKGDYVLANSTGV